ncbi:monooxygenase [Mycolicibacterium madagascariense]|uniref:Monooxygenase n=1 Tax=Mycolicibacterium madagascariense TaxID=212765 RepID=A0A7I7XI87_9MYCO|nr:NAD(P)/FAD-dependent oxidoreductase [Mycolicibacterium madagascariense]MCV7010957.1 NAD(P)/FAD-dependent oxidoreductase [Mycolicibacterium madagascariense]BBZ28952.1 monooxygenase [Mycolicibacterium madagascariense]
MSAPEHQVVVIGAGMAGLGVALCLSDLAVRSVLVDRDARVGASWRNRYDALRLNTGARYSHLPKRPYAKGTPQFPTRDQVIAHLDEHAGQRGIEWRMNTPVERVVRRTPSGWGVVTGEGIVDTAHVVVATGPAHTPSLPDWPGSESFAGEVLHSSAYRNPAPFAGKRVLVVGAGSSGMEIAHDLAKGGAAKVWLSVRTPPNLLPRTGPLGQPNDVLSRPLYRIPPRWADAISRRRRLAAFGDLTDLGLPIPEEGPFSRAHRLGVSPSLVDPDVVDAVRDGSVEVVAALTSFEGTSAVLTDRARLAADAVIAATGYRNGLAPLVGHLGVLTDAGRPMAHGDVAAAPGLWFHGLMPRPSLIGYTSMQSQRLAGRIAREIAEAGRPRRGKLF